VGDRALRVDMLERLADLIRTKDVWNGFEADVDMLSITGLTLEQFAEVLRNLGYMAQKGNRKKASTAINISDQPPKIETTGIDFLNEKKEEVEIVKEVEVEVYYVFKLQKKPKFKSKTDTKDTSENRKGSDFKTTSKFNKNRKSFTKPSPELKIKKEQPIDPDNPFLALLELKNKL
jgi:ATP-dependent RNA helicase SUPV3L1/SUV3